MTSSGLPRQNLDAHVEDVGTIYRLRWEAIAVCLDFLHGGEGLTSRLSQIINPSAPGTTQTSPGCVGIPVSRNLATLHEMQTVYGLSDAYEMLEIIAVDGHNQRLWSKFHERR